MSSYWYKGIEKILEEYGNLLNEVTDLETKKGLGTLNIDWLKLEKMDPANKDKIKEIDLEIKSIKEEIDKLEKELVPKRERLKQLKEIIGRKMEERRKEIKKEKK